MRHVEVSRTGEKDIVGVSFKAPQALHKDNAAMIALGQIVAGGNTSHLYTRLVENGKATSVWYYYFPFHDASLFSIQATVTDSCTHEVVQEDILACIQAIAQKGVTKTELQRVIAQLRTEMAAAHDGHLSLSSFLAEGVAAGDWRYYFTLPKKLEELTPSDVQKAAQTYCVERNMTTGFYRSHV